MQPIDTDGPVAAELTFADLEARVLTTESATVRVAPLTDDPDPGDDDLLERLVAVELDGDRLRVEERKGARRLLRGRTLGVVVTLPRDSALRITTTTAAVTLTGTLGDTHIESSSGRVVADRVARLTVEASHGELSVGAVTGDAELTLASAAVALGTVGGAARVTGAGGELAVDDVTGPLTVMGSSCTVAVGHVRDDAEVTVSSGDVRLAAVHRGKTTVMTGSGDIAVGVPVGTVAWLEADSKKGAVTNRLPDHADPAGFTEQAELRLQTRSGDVDVHRAA